MSVCGREDVVTEHGLQQRLEDLEGRYAFLDDTVQSLNGVIAAQQRLIDDLVRELEQLRETMRSQPRDPDGTPEPPPPHY